MAGVRAVSVEQVRDAAARLAAVLLETKRWDSGNAFLDAMGRSYSPGAQQQLEKGREGEAQQWAAGQRATITRYADLVLALDPLWFQDQAAAHSSAESLIRLSVGNPATGSVGDAADLTEALAAVERNLGSWQGEGAEAFKTQLQRIRDFDEQQANLLVQLGLTMIAGRDAVLAARASFVSVCEDAIAAAGAYREETSAREARVTAFIVVGVLASALTLLSAGAAPGGIGLATYVFSWAGGGAAVAGQAISTGNTVVLTTISSSDLESVTAGFVTNQDRVIANLDDEMVAIADRCTEFDHQYGPGARLLAPLPPSTDVHAPGYTYEDLRSEDHPPGAAFDTAIHEAAAARRPPAVTGGPISRALNPDH